MRVAYLTNQYPLVRHTFIRREIVALESLGVEISRFSIRDSHADLVDQSDRDEYQKTRSLLGKSKASLLISTIKHALTRPIRFFKASTKTLKLGRRSDRGVLRHLVYLAEACLLRDWLNRDGIKHLHVHFATNPAAVAMLCEILGGPTYSITVHGPEEWDRPESLSLREKYEHAQFVVAVTDFGRCQVFRWTHRDYWPKVHVVRCGVDDAWLSLDPGPIPETNRLVLVAGLVEQKGHLLLLEALQIVHNQKIDFEMIFVGDGPLRSVLEDRVKSMGLGNQVKFLGWQSNQQVRDHLRDSRALIMPSFAENLPVAMMEALAMGRPVLGTYIAGVPELVQNGINGWLVPAGNSKLTAQAMIQILQTPVSKLTEMGVKGAKLIRELHDAKIEAGKMKKLFSQLLEPVTKAEIS